MTLPNSRPRVLIVGNFLSKYGSSRQVCEELALKLQEANYQVTTTSNRRARLSRLKDVLSVIWKKRHEYDVAQVDVFSGPAFFLSAAAVRLLKQIGKPFVLTLHGGGLPDYARKRPKSVSAILRSAAAVTVPSRYLLKEMEPYRPDLILLPNALSVDAYGFRQRNPLSPSLVWLRSFHHIYAPIQVPRVVALLKDEFPDMRVTMVGADKGDGSLAETVSEAKTLGVSELIQFSGPVAKSEVPAILNGGDIFLNTTTLDNTPVSVLEALASGACVVSTNVGGIPYLLENERQALLVPPDDATAMARAVQRLLTEPSLAQTLQQAGREFVEDFDWSSVLPRWHNLFEMANRGKAPHQHAAAALPQ